VEKPEGKRPLARPRRGWVENIKMIGWSGMDWMDVTQDRDQWRALVNTVMNFRVPQNVAEFLSSCTTGCFSRRSQLHKVSYLSGYHPNGFFYVFLVEHVWTTEWEARQASLTLSHDASLKSLSPSTLA
jgi:hypothetical protein